MKNLWGQKKSDEHAWQEARRTHQLEHASGLTVTIPCDAIGHMQVVDQYSEVFDADQCRKFCTATGRQW